MYKDVGIVLNCSTNHDCEQFVEIWIDDKKVYAIPLKYVQTMNWQDLNTQMSVVLGQALHKLIRKVNGDEQ